MRALIWIVEDTWRATVDAARMLLPAGAATGLLHVAAGDAEQLAGASRAGLLGRRHPPPGRRVEPLREISEQASRELLAEAALRLGGSPAISARRGRVEREVIAAAEGWDLLLLARDGDHARLGPASLGPAARFVVDHAPCTVVLAWADEAPAVETIPPPPH